MQIILKLTSIAILQPSFLPLLRLCVRLRLRHLPRLLPLLLPSSPFSPSSPSSSSGTCRYLSYPADKRRCSLPQNQEACWRLSFSNVTTGNTFAFGSYLTTHDHQSYHVSDLSHSDTKHINQERIEKKLKRKRKGSRFV